MTAVATAPVRAAVVQVDGRLVALVWRALIYGIAACAGAYGVLAPRAATQPSPLASLIGDPSVRLLQSASALVVVAAALGAIAIALPHVAGAPPRLAERRPAVLLALLGTTVIGSALVNGVPVHVGMLAMPLLAIAVTILPAPPGEVVARSLLVSLRAFVWTSLAAALVAPAWAMQRHYDSLIGIGTRLVGATPHANALGALAAALVVCEVSRRPRSVAAIAAAATALVWSQSKTAWVAVVLLGVVALGAFLRRPDRRASVAPVLAVVGVVGVSMVAVIQLGAPTRDTARTETGAETFTGRTAIWEVTVEVWQHSPLLGVGPRLWDEAMDNSYERRVGFAPGQAHNQLVHTLGEAGAVGAAVLVVFLFALAGAGRRAGGIATALAVVVAITCFSETPVRSVPFSTNLLLVVGAVALTITGGGETVDG